MDSLSNLPVSGGTQNPQEKAIMDRYFDPSQDVATSTTWGGSLKVSGLASVLFILLCNPLIDKFIGAVPYVGANGITITATKTALFFILFLFIYKYCV